MARREEKRREEKRREEKRREEKRREESCHVICVIQSHLTLKSPCRDDCIRTVLGALETWI